MILMLASVAMFVRLYFMRNSILSERITDSVSLFLMELKTVSNVAAAVKRINRSELKNA